MTCSIRVRMAVLAGLTLSIASHAAPAAAQSERLEITGLQAPVEIVTDRWGINHIYAENEADLFFAQGYAAARDRLFQFEIWRRRATGTVAEILGPRELQRDVGARLHRFRGDMTTEMNHYHDRGDQIIPAFVRGINAYVDQAAADPSLLPIEFELLGITPRALDPGGRHLAPSGAGGERRRRDRQRARGGPARPGRRQGVELLLRRPRPDHRSGGGPVAAARRHPRPVPRAPAPGAVRAGGRRAGLARRPGHVRAPRRRPAERDRPRAAGLRGHRQQQLGGRGQPHADGVSADGQRPPPRAERAVAPLLGPSGGAGVERHRGRRAGAAGGVDRAQRARGVGADGLRAGQRGPLRVRHQSRESEPVPAPGGAGRR